MISKEHTHMCARAQWFYREQTVLEWEWLVRWADTGKQGGEVMSSIWAVKANNLLQGTMAHHTLEECYDTLNNTRE